MVALVLNFLIGFSVSFIGCLPPAAPHAAVMNISVKFGMRSVLLFILATEMVEFLYSYIAIYFSKSLQSNSKLNDYMHIVSILTFIATGFYFFFKKETQAVIKQKDNSFLLGIIMGFLNPVVIVFWVATTSLLLYHNWLNFHFYPILLYVIGLCSGSFLAFILYGLFARKINSKLKWSVSVINKITGILLVVFALLDILYMIIK